MAHSPRLPARSANGAWSTTPEEEKCTPQGAGELAGAGQHGDQRALGETVEVLVEDQHKGKWRGATGRTSSSSSRATRPLRGRLVEAQITWTGPWSMQGRFARTRPPDRSRRPNKPSRARSESDFNGQKTAHVKADPMHDGMTRIERIFTDQERGKPCMCLAT